MHANRIKRSTLTQLQEQTLLHPRSGVGLAETVVEDLEDAISLLSLTHANIHYILVGFYSSHQRRNDHLQREVGLTHDLRLALPLCVDINTACRCCHLSHNLNPPDLILGHLKHSSALTDYYSKPECPSQWTQK